MKKRCVLFVHGFMGGPEQFDRLFLFVRALGVDAVAPTLPGHGGDVNDFYQATPDDWQACVRDALHDLRGRYDELFIVTHSMGGLLALRETSERPDRVRGILSLALPLRIRVTPACMKLWLSVGLFPNRIKNPRIAAAKDACTVNGITALNAVKLLPGALGLLRLAKRARRDIHLSRVPLTALQSPRDEIVSPSSARLAEQAGARVRVLNASGHFWYAEEDFLIIEKTLAAMLDSGVQEANIEQKN